METPAHYRANPSGIGSAAGSLALRIFQLSASRRAVVRLCQSMNYGSIQGLCVKDGEPALSPPPLALVDVKLDAVAAPVRPPADELSCL
jgi:hypothetical protein